MAANPLYYTKRHSTQIQAACPQMTQEHYMEGYDRANSLVNTMIGVANEVARIAIADAIDAVKKAGKFRQETKRLCNETFRRQEEYEAIHNQNFGDRLKMWLDYLDGTEEEYRRHIFNIYMAVKMVLDRHRQSDTELKARIECARICAELAVGQFDALMHDLQDRYGVDTRRVRSHCRRFYHIGNDDIHRRDPIMKMPHRRLQFDWLVTRGDASKARIYVWENKDY